MGEWKKVTSSNLRRIRYFKKRKLLVVEFNESIYAVENVPWKIYLGLIHAESKGKYYNKNIRGKYNYQIIPYTEAEKMGLIAPVEQNTKGVLTNERVQS